MSAPFPHCKGEDKLSGYPGNEATIGAIHVLRLRDTRARAVQNVLGNVYLT